MSQILKTKKRGQQKKSPFEGLDTKIIRVKTHLSCLFSMDKVSSTRHFCFSITCMKKKNPRSQVSLHGLGSCCPRGRELKDKLGILRSNPDGDLIATIFCKLPGREMFFQGRTFATRHWVSAVCSWCVTHHQPFPPYDCQAGLGWVGWGWVGPAGAQSSLSVCTNQVDGNDLHWDSGWVLKYNGL